MTGRVRDLKQLRKNSLQENEPASNNAADLIFEDDSGMSEGDLRERLRLARKEVQNRDITIRALQRNYEALASSTEGGATDHKRRKEAFDALSDKFSETDAKLTAEKKNGQLLKNKVIQLEREIGLLRGQMEGSVSEAKEKLQQAEQSTQELMILRAAMESIKSDLQKKEKNCDEMKDQLTKVLAWNDESDKKIAEMDANLEKSKSANSQLRVELEGTKKQLEEMKKKYASLESMSGSSVKEITTAKATIEKLQKELSATIEQRDQIQVSLSNVCSELEERDRTHPAMLAKLQADFATKEKSLEQQKAQAEGLYKESNEKNSKLEMRISQLERTGGDLIQKHQETDRTLNQLQEDVKQRELLMKRSEHLTGQLSKDLETAIQERTNLEGKLRVTSEELSDCRNTIAAQSDKIEGLSKQLASEKKLRKEENEEFEKRKQKLETQYAELSHAVGNKEQSNSTLTSQVASLTKQLNSAKSELEDKQRQLHGSLEAQSRAQIENSKLNKTINEIKESAKKSSKEAADAMARLDNLTAEKCKLEQQLQYTTEQLNMTKAHSEEVERLHIEVVGKLEAVEVEKQRALSQMTEMKQKIVGLENDFAEEKKALKSHSSKSDELSKQLQNLTNSLTEESKKAQQNENKWKETQEELKLVREQQKKDYVKMDSLTEKLSSAERERDLSQRQERMAQGQIQQLNDELQKERAKTQAAEARAQNLELDPRQQAINDKEKSMGLVVERIRKAADAMEGCLTCMSCLSIFKAPVTCMPCGHSYCKSCFEASGLENDVCDDVPFCKDCGPQLAAPRIFHNETLEQLCSRFVYQRQALEQLTIKR